MPKKRHETREVARLLLHAGGRLTQLGHTGCKEELRSAELSWGPASAVLDPAQHLREQGRRSCTCRFWRQTPRLRCPESPRQGGTRSLASKHCRGGALRLELGQLHLTLHWGAGEMHGKFTSPLFERTRIAPRPKLPNRKNRRALLFRDAQMQGCRPGSRSV